MNSIYISGRIGKDPELKTAQNGKEYVNFGVAVDRRKKDKDAPTITDWFNVVAFDKMASFVCSYFHKGDGIEIRGRMEDDQYTDKDTDKKMHSWRIMAEQIEFSKGRKTDSGTAGNNASDSDTPNGFLPINDDDIPF